MTLRVTESAQGGWTVLRIRGELDLVTSPAVRQSVHDAVADGRHDVVLDLSEVLFCDSSGVGVLIAARRLMRSCGGRLRLILPPGARRRAPTSTGCSPPSAYAVSSRSTPTGTRPSTSGPGRSPRETAPVAADRTGLDDRLVAPVERVSDT